MSEKDLPIIITKKDCPRCVTMKEWLKDNKIEYTERDIDDESYVQQLVRDKEFLKTFCDDESCIVNTPAVSYKGKYWFKELWDEDGLKKKKAAKLFKK